MRLIQKKLEKQKGKIKNLQEDLQVLDEALKRKNNPNLILQDKSPKHPTKERTRLRNRHPTKEHKRMILKA